MSDRDYLKSISDYSKHMIDKQDVIGNIDFSRIIEPYLKGLNPDKLALYIAYKSLKKAKYYIDKKDYYNAQRHLFYVSAYLDGDFNRKVILDFYTFGNMYYKRDNLKKDFNNVLINNPNLKDVSSYDRDLFVGNNVEENKIAIDRILNINKIKTDEFFVKSGKGGHPRTNNPDDSYPVDPGERKMAKRFQQERELFYYSKNPMAVIDCVNKFSNFKGFLFENGIIIADRVLNMNTLSETKKDAGYVFDASDFEDDIKFDKFTLRRMGHPFIVHDRDWKDDVDMYVNKDTSEELKEEAKKLSLKKRI